MDAIINLFTTIGTVITSTVDFLVSMVMDIVYVVQLGVEFLATIPAYFAWLPSPVLALLLTIFSVMIILKVAGR